MDKETGGWQGEAMCYFAWSCDEIKRNGRKSLVGSRGEGHNILWLPEKQAAGLIASAVRKQRQINASAPFLPFIRIPTRG